VDGCDWSNKNISALANFEPKSMSSINIATYSLFTIQNKGEENCTNLSKYGSEKKSR